MNRALVLIGCLAAAGAVAAYSKQSEEPFEQTQVFTVRAASPVPAAPPAPITRVAADTPADRAALVRDLQRELKRVGCYSGEVNGIWTTSSRLAMKSFTDKVNASLPIDNPDEILLSLVRGYKDTACAGSAIESARPAPPATEPAAEPKANAGAAPGPAAVAGAVLAGSAVMAKSAPQPPPEPKRTRADATADEPEERHRAAERPRRYSAAAPPERVYKRRSRRYSSNPRPPKFVRNVLRAFGIR